MMADVAPAAGQADPFVAELEAKIKPGAVVPG